jgi:hypothetical protein
MSNGCECDLARIVFISSQTYPPNFGGVAVADAACQSLATAAGLIGTYRAWLSVPGNTPALRFTHATVPYRRTDGIQIAANWTDLTDGTIANFISVDELGNPWPTAQSFTGTDSDGNLHDPMTDGHCSGWTSTSGPPWAGTGSTWKTNLEWSYDLQAGINYCSLVGNQHFYCFEQ